MSEYIKTETEIEKDVFRVIKASTLPSVIGGEVYRKGMRPLDSQKEDAVVSFLSGMDGQEQNGVVVLDVYVPRIKHGTYTNKVRNIPRIEALERVIVDLFANLDNTEYLFSVDTTPQSLDMDDTQQTMIYTRINYRRKIF
jgi:hypothetical protein